MLHSDKFMRFLFIHYTSDVLGGIETLIGRMSGHLIKEGHAVDVLTTSANHWKTVLPSAVRCVELGGKFRDLFYPGRASRTWTKSGLERPDIIKTFDLPTSWCGALLARRYSGAIKLVSGIYNPYVFDTSKGAQVLMHGWALYLKNYLKNIPPSSRVVCDPAIGEELEHIHGPGQTAHYLPIPIDGARYLTVDRKPEWGHIVSIGRLAPMKEYNFYMVEAIRELRRRGHNVRWSVFGSGPYGGELKERIEKSGMQPWISIRGEVPYSQMGITLETAYVFVGMGTALIEASFCRVPNVVAIAYDRSGKTYGAIDELPFGAMGQLLNAPPQRNVADEIEKLLLLNPDQYLAASNRVYDSVQAYEMSGIMRRFYEIVFQALPPRRAHLLYFANYMYAAARLAGVNLDEFLLRKPVKR